MNNLTVQKVCIFLITLCFFFAAPWMIAQFLEGNSLPFFIILGIGVLFLFLFVLKDRCWLIIPFCMPIEGRLNFLPVNFSMLELSIIYVSAYILLQIVMGRNIAWSLGPWALWVFLAPLLGILLYHWIRSGDIGIRALGGSGWGGRMYFQIFLYACSVPLIASFSGSSLKNFSLVPLIYLLGTLVDLVPNTLTTLVPGLAPYIFRFYSAVNISEYGQEVRGAFGSSADFVSRFRNFAFFGIACGVAILSYFPFKTWLRPSRLWIFPLLVLCFLMAAFSGFRSSIFNFVVALTACFICTTRAKAVFLFPIGLVAVGLIVFSQGVIVNYPISIQRALSFLPGQWSEVALKDARGSNEWREEMRELFFGEYFQKAPLLGQGYHYDPIYSLQERDIYLRIAVMQTQDRYHQTRPFIERRNPHEGDLHLFLAVGVTGFVCFAGLCLTLLWTTFYDALRWAPESLPPTLVWGTALVSQTIFGFFLVFGEVAPALGVLCPIAAILAAQKKLLVQAAQLSVSWIKPKPLSEAASPFSTSPMGDFR